MREGRPDEDWHGWFASLPEDELDVTERVLGELERRRGASSRPSWLVPFLLGGIAACVLLVGLLRLAPRPSRSLDPSPGAICAHLEDRRGEILLDGAPVDGTSRTIDLAAGSHLALSPQASAVLVMGTARTRLGPGSRAQVLVGLLRLEVGRVVVSFRPSPEGFRVETPLLICAVRGTRFTVDVGIGGSSVDLLEGHVEVSAAGGDAKWDLQGSARLDLKVDGTASRTKPSVDASRLKAYADLEGRSMKSLDEEIRSKAKAIAAPSASGTLAVPPPGAGNAKEGGTAASPANTTAPSLGKDGPEGPSRPSPSTSTGVHGEGSFDGPVDGSRPPLPTGAPPVDFGGVTVEGRR